MDLRTASRVFNRGNNKPEVNTGQEVVNPNATKFNVDREPSGNSFTLGNMAESSGYYEDENEQMLDDDKELSISFKGLPLKLAIKISNMKNVMA